MKKSTATCLLLTLGLIGSLGSVSLDRDELLSLLTGYGFFTLNLSMLIFLSALGVQWSKGDTIAIPRVYIFAIGICKFVLVVLGLYFALGLFKLPALYFATGAFMALVAMLGSLIFDYFRSKVLSRQEI